MSSCCYKCPAAVMVLALEIQDILEIPWPILVYACMSGITFVFMAGDKYKARKGKRRISEATLHGLELAFGWPGSLLAQHLCRHKRRKKSYQVAFWFIVILHVAFWAWWFLGRS